MPASPAETLARLRALKAKDEWTGAEYEEWCRHESALLDVAEAAVQLLGSADKMRMLTGKGMGPLLAKRQMSITEDALRTALARLADAGEGRP